MGGSVKAADLWSGLVLAAFGAWIISQAWHWRFIGPDGPGAGFFPLWHGIAILVLSLALVCKSLLKTSGDARAINWRGGAVGISVWAAFALAIALIKVLGFSLILFLFTFFVVTVIYRRAARVATGVSAASVVGFYLVFTLGLGVRLPAGPWGF